VVVVGARQTGKTTLIRQAFPSYHYVTLDLPSEAQSAEHDPVAFLARHPRPLIVDEVQYAPGLFRHLKAVVDSGERVAGQFILTGSQKFALMQGVAESLAGRAAVLSLEPLAVAELAAAGGFAEQLADPALVVHRGLFPELWRQPDLPSAEFYAAYVATYLQRDLRVALDVGNLRDFERFLRLCAIRTGQLLNKTDLARDAGISTKTAASWLSALEACNQITLLEPWSGNLSKRLMKSPKLYLNDPGLAAFLMGLGLDAVRQSPWSGALWETLVFAELRKSLSWQAAPTQWHYYRDLDGLEVDFVLQDGAALDLIECKWTELPTERDANGLRRVAAALEQSTGLSVRRRWVACRTGHAWPLGDVAQAVPGLSVGAMRQI
jgi:hypothetical protein